MRAAEATVIRVAAARYRIQPGRLAHVAGIPLTFPSHGFISITGRSVPGGRLERDRIKDTKVMIA